LCRNFHGYHHYWQFALSNERVFEFHQSGSHIQLRHEDKPMFRVTVPFHRTDLTPKTLKSIIRQAGLTVDEFIQLL